MKPRIQLNSGFINFFNNKTDNNFICPNSSWGSRVINLVKDFPLPKNKAVTLQGMGIEEIDLVNHWDLWNP